MLSTSTFPSPTPLECTESHRPTARHSTCGRAGPMLRCSMAKGIRAPTPHRTTSRAVAPLDMVHIDTTRPFPESLGGSRYVVMFVDSAFRFQRPYGTRDKSTSAILDVAQRFVADMGVPRAFRTDNGAEYTNSAFVEYCNSLQICRELTAPYTPQQATGERALAGHQGGTRGMHRGQHALPGHAPGKTQGSSGP